VWSDLNPFDTSFAQAEIAFYGVETYADGKGLKIRSLPIQWRCDDLLNTMFHVGEVTAPMLTLDGELWMSLSPMEIQSHYVPIGLASGHVGVAGLGLGYFTLRAAAKPEVTKITVFECDERVAAYFTSTFHNRDGFEKIEIILGDARHEMVGFEFDLLFVDIYATMLPDEALEDVELFLANNGVKRYHFWARERVLLDAILTWKQIDWCDIDHETRLFFNKWICSDVDGHPLPNFYQPRSDPQYTERALDMLDNAGQLDCSS